MSPRHVTVSPDMVVRAKAGLLWAALIAVVTGTAVCTAYAVRMDSKITALQESVKRIDTHMETTAPQHVILWNQYERTAAKPNTSAPQIH